VTINRLGNALIIAMPSHTIKYYGTFHLQHKKKVDVIPDTEMGRYTTKSTSIPALRSTPPITWKVSNKKLRIIRHATIHHAALVALRLAQYAQTLE
jgi:hypothetical protein